MRRRTNGWRGVGLLMLALCVAACGDETPPLEPDPALAPFVGTWDAEVFVVTSVADPGLQADLLNHPSYDGSFNVVIQPSGLYTATLVFGQLSPVVEIGQLTVAGSFVTLTPNGGTDCPGSSEYVFTAPDYLVLDGPTCFDFNLDGQDEDATAQLELRRR